MNRRGELLAIIADLAARQAAAWAELAALEGAGEAPAPKPPPSAPRRRTRTARVVPSAPVTISPLDGARAQKIRDDVARSLRRTPA